MKNKHRPLIFWLSLICLMVYAMVFVGGITRLTDSGLSMVEWKPIMGTIPPLNDSEWNIAFEKYKQYPEYKLINHQMSLDEFKSIFFWEYSHRVLGRLIGLFFFLPLLFFQFTGRLRENKLSLKMWVGFFLGGLQGLMGWYMVKSGLVDKPDVSHMRLAAHLMLALAIFCYLFWHVLDLLQLKRQPSKKWFYATLGLFALVCLQITYGAFTAGLKAGFGFNTFPLMGSHFIPNGLSMLAGGFFENIFHNNIAVQFIHRMLAWALLLITFFMLYKSQSAPLSKRQKKSVLFLSTALCIQFVLGVITLVLFVPLPLAALHQTGAFIVLACTVQQLHAFK